MLLYITGVPGAGKTYYAVNYIFQNHDKFYRVYTNIAGFNYQNNIYPLVYKELYPKLTKLYTAYKKQIEEKELIKLAQELDLYNCLFVFDEAQNHFMQVDQVLVWWLTYHRHLSQDIILITQNLSLINAKYKPLAEKFIKALPSSMRLFSNILRYNVYIDSRMYKTTKVATEKLKFNKEVYALYHSGKAEKHKSVIMKFVAFGFIGLILVGALFYAISHYFFGGSSSNTKITSHSAPTKLTKQVEDPYTDTDIDLSKAKILNLMCIDKKCSFQKFDIPYDKLDFLLQPYKLLEVTNFKYQDHDFVIITLISSSPLLFQNEDKKKISFLKR